jgi:hypothetical protein
MGAPQTTERILVPLHIAMRRVVYRVHRIAIERRRERVFQPVAGTRPVEDLPAGRVNSSSRISQARTCTPRSSTGPHISLEACNCPHTAGRSGCPKILQRSWTSSCTQGTPAGLPCGMPGMGEEMEGAVQQAAQPGRQVKVIRFWASGSAWPQGPHLQGLLQAARQLARSRAGACVIVGPHGTHEAAPVSWASTKRSKGESIDTSTIGT